MDKRLIAKMAKNLDEGDIERGIHALMEHKVVPELEDVKRRAGTDVTSQEVREIYRSYPDDVQEDLFYTQLKDVVGTCFDIRDDPFVGFMRLKEMLRDPYVFEALLLIFENEELTEASRDEMKDFVALHARYVGMALLPEMYTATERDEIAERFDIDQEMMARFEEAVADADVTDVSQVAEQADVEQD